MDPISLTELSQTAAKVPAPSETRAQVESVAEKTTKDGKPYYAVGFADGEGRLVLRAWSDSPVFSKMGNLRQGLFVELTGEFYRNDRFGLDACNWDFRLLTDDEKAALLKGGDALRQRQDADYAAIVELVESLRDSRLRLLCEKFLERLGGRFKRTGAARHFHHARRGGLVEHTAQMMRSADALSGAYQELNRDLLLTGALFHDCGKLWENCYVEEGFTMPISERAELLGHIPMGIELVNALWRDLLEEHDDEGWKDLEPSSEDVRFHLLHLIASHHGEYAFGSPVLPKTPEAMALHYIDNLDAKLEMMRHAHANASLVERNIFEKTRPLGVHLIRPLPAFEPDEEPDEDGLDVNIEPGEGADGQSADEE